MNGRVDVACALAVLAFGAGCPVWVDGSFDDVVFAPGATAVAVFDKHDVLERNGAILPVERSRQQQQLDLWLSSAVVDVDEDWRTYDAERLAELRTRIALADNLVIDGMSWDALGDGDTLTARDDAGAVSGDFSFSLSHRAFGRDDAARAAAGLGARVTVTAEAERIESVGRGGTARLVLEIQRERASGQPASDLALGEVTITVDLPLAPERLTEANLAIVAPIVRCAAAAGPFAGADCADEPALPVIDGSGVH